MKVTAVPTLVYERLPPLGVAVHRNDLRSLVDVSLRCRPADPAGTAGDDRGPSIQSSHVLSPLCFEVGPTLLSCP